MYWNEHKTKSEYNDTVDKYKYFLESNFAGVTRLYVLNYSKEDGNWKRYYLPKGIIRNYDIILNGKSFYNQPTDCNIKRYEETRKLTTKQGEDYTTGHLLDYEYIKNHYRLIAVDLSQQKN